MSTTPPPPPPPPEPNPDVQRYRDVYLLAARALRTSLPPPVTDTEEEWALHDSVAITELASLVPANAAEIHLAVNHVAANAHATACLEDVALHMDDPKRADQIRAQSARMGREARGYMGALLRLQAARRKRDRTDEEADSAAWLAHGTITGITEAMASLPPGRLPGRSKAVAAQAAGASAAAEAAPPGKTANPPDPVPFRPYEEWTDEEKRLDLLCWTTERWAIQHTLDAKLIRQLGGLPPDCTFEPPPPEVLHELIHRQDSGVTWVDDEEPWVPPSPG